MCFLVFPQNPNLQLYKYWRMEAFVSVGDLCITIERKALTKGMAPYLGMYVCTFVLHSSVFCKHWDLFHFGMSDSWSVVQHHKWLGNQTIETTHQRWLQYNFRCNFMHNGKNKVKEQLYPGDLQNIIYCCALPLLIHVPESEFHTHSPLHQCRWGRAPHSEQLSR